MRSLQEWYKQVNGTYLDRNFYRSIESVFAHLVEVCQGLSVAATPRRKRDLDRGEFLPKAIAWWLALCGRAGVPKVETIVWAKFPHLCPYCNRCPHKGNECKESNPARAKIDWETLAASASERIAEIPQTLPAWQQLFNDVYPRDDSTNNETNVHRLAEELGELAEAVRALPVAPEYFVSEAPDVFAWLMGFANQFDWDRREDLHHYGRWLNEAMKSQYPGHCLLCRRSVCKCAPIPASTLGRIATEVPRKFFAPGRLFNLSESVELFNKVEIELLVGGQLVTADKDEIAQIRKDTEAILSALEQQNAWKPQLLVSLAATVGSLGRIAEQGELTQAAIDEVLAYLKRLPSEHRQTALGFLNNLAASATYAAMVAAAKAVGAG